MARPAPADIPEIFAQQPQPGSDPFGDLMVLRDIQPDLSGMDFIAPSGVDLGDLDIPDAVTLLSQADQAAIAEAKKFLSAENKFAEAVAELGAFNQGLSPGSQRYKDASGKFTNESLEAFFEKQGELQDALQVARANYEAVGGKPETLLNQILGAATTVGAAPSAGAAAAGIPPFNQVLYNIPSILAGQPIVTGSYSDAGTQTPFKIGEKDGTIIAGTTGSQAGDEALAGIFGGEAIITETGDLNVPSRENIEGVLGGIFTDPTTGTLIKTAATTDTDATDENTVVGIDTTKVDTVTGGDGNDTLVDTVTGGDGNDTLVDDAGTGVDTVIGGAGNDTLVDTTKSDKFTGAGEITTKVGPPLIFVPPGGTPPGGTPPDGGDEDDDEEIIETLLTGGDGDPEVEEEIIETTTETPEPTKTTSTTTGGGGGGGTLRLPPSLRGVREEPGDVVDIDYLYDFAKGLDQPFLTTNEDDEVKNLSVFAEGGPTDAVDMLTRPRRPGEYGRRYFEDAVFTPTGTALGGEALDPTKIQIPQYKFERDLLPQFKMPTQTMPSSAAVPMDAVSYTATPNEDIDVDTLLELVGLIGMEGLGFAAGGMAMGGPNYLAGATDGMADLIPATIGGTQPAALSDGEFVIPADVVSHLGNGNSDAGAKELYAMMDRVRDERTGTTKQGPEINPTKMMPA